MTAPQHKEAVLDVRALAELSAIAEKLYPESTDVISALHDYRDKLEELCSYTTQGQYAYLLDFLIIILDGLEQLIVLDRSISSPEYIFLRNIPKILSEYLLTPNNVEANEHLLELLKDPQWIRPITAEEEKDLTASISTDQNNAHCNDCVDLDDLLSGISDDATENNVDLQDEISVIDIVDSLQHEIDTDEVDTNEEVEKDLSASISTDQNDAQYNDCIELDDLLSEISDDATENNVDLQDEISVIDIVDSLQHEIDTGEIDTNEIETIPGIDSNHQELIDLIKIELEEIIDNQYAPEHDVISTDPQQCVIILNNIADQTENISNALDLIGLEGLSQCGNFISRNISSFSNSIDTFDKNKEFILKQWPIKLLKCLQNVNDAESVSGLLKLLSNEAWQVTLDSTEYAQIKALLENPVFLEEEQQERQVKATDEDVNLILPEDVNQELLDGLLQDLPTQTEEFSTAIQNIAEGGGMENIDIAQRIAHTLKGAANVVGVNGIANLTHHLEDLLEAQAKANALPSTPLINVLVRASDCLESMTEALLGIDVQPDDAVTVLQDVLDWANKLDNNSVVHIDNNDVDSEIIEPANLDIAIPDNSTETPDTDNEKQQNQSNTTAENALRIPVSLADEMLRLAGENLIHTSQIHEHIQVIAKKQDALDLHNQSLLQLSYDLEHLIDIEGFKPLSDTHNTDDVFDSLEMDEYHEIHTVSRRLVEIAADSVQLSQELDKDLSGLKELVVDQDQLHKESEELVLRTRMVPVKTIIPRLKRGVRQVCRITEKQVELTVRDNNTLMDSEVLNSLIEPIMHILRNAIDHGIENEADRLARGKNPNGSINLVFERKGNQILIDIIDDGQGLNTDIIYSNAINSGLIKSDDELSDENIQKLILEPGFTTREKVTHISGRGIGLDVVTVKIRELKGSINISSNVGEGCRFSLILPISSFSTHSLLVRCRMHVYAISSHGVEEILYPGIGEIRDVGDVTIFQLGQDVYSVVLLDRLLNLPEDRRNIERNTCPILLVKDETGTKTAIVVQKVLDSRDVVVKSMGRYIPKLNGIVGATVLGDGSVSPVIDLPEMLHNRNSLEPVIDNDSQEDTSFIQSRKLPYVLVVDDSLSARRSLAQFVEDLGFTVRTARDGMEALGLIEMSKPDLLLVDMEMPKMNGLELTSHVRSTPNINNIPVIMITSRSTDKHRKIAMDKGVSHYMVKPFDEDELAQHINNMLEIT